MTAGERFSFLIKGNKKMSLHTLSRIISLNLSSILAVEIVFRLKFELEYKIKFQSDLDFKLTSQNPIPRSPLTKVKAEEK